MLHLHLKEPVCVLATRLFSGHFEFFLKCVFRTKLDRELPPGQFKIELGVKEGTHSTASEVTKQINDKEGVDHDEIAKRFQGSDAFRKFN